MAAYNAQLAGYNVQMDIYITSMAVFANKSDHRQTRLARKIRESPHDMPVHVHQRVWRTSLASPFGNIKCALNLCMQAPLRYCPMDRSQLAQ